MKCTAVGLWMKKAAFPVLSIAFSEALQNVKFMAIPALNPGSIIAIPEMELLPNTRY